MLTVFGYVVAVSASVPEVLQLARTARMRRIPGLAPVTQFSYLMSWSAWTLYGVRLGDGPVIVSSAVAAAVSSAMVVLLLRIGALPRLRTLGAPAAAFALAAAVAWVEPRAGGTLLAVAELTFFVPQLLMALRSDDLSGVSPLAVGWEFATALGWVAYTLLSGIPEAGVFSTVYALLLAPVLWRVMRFCASRRRR